MNFAELTQNYFLTESNRPELRAWLEQAEKACLDFLQNSKTDKIHSDVTLRDLERIFAWRPLPLDGEGLASVIKETIDFVFRHSVRVTNPNFIGHMTGSTPYFGLLADLFISALNQNVVKIETALSASYIEDQVLAWLHGIVFKRSDSLYQRAIHDPEISFGNITNGGTMGNLTALTVARNTRFPEAASQGFGAALVRHGLERVVILASKRVHYSMRKVASVLGLGADNVLELPVEHFTNRLRIDELRSQLRAFAQGKTRVLAVVGIAGSTETGSVDDLEQLAQVAAEHGVWFHVDAAWGGPLLLSDRFGALLKGIERADSVVVDGHKLFYLPMSHGAVLFQDERALEAIKHSARYIIREGSVDLGRTSLEGSRRFDSLKLWFFLKVLGRNGYAALIDASVDLAHHFAQSIVQHASFELTSAPETNILTYRYVPRAWKARVLALAKQLTQGGESAGPGAEAVNSFRLATQFLNAVNIDIQKQQRQNGKSFVSRTTLESVTPGIDTVVFRAVLFNPLTNPQILADILSEQMCLGDDIARRRWRRFKSSLPENFGTFFPQF